MEVECGKWWLITTLLPGSMCYRATPQCILCKNHRFLEYKMKINAKLYGCFYFFRLDSNVSCGISSHLLHFVQFFSSVSASVSIEGEVTASGFFLLLMSWIVLWESAEWCEPFAKQHIFGIAFSTLQFIKLGMAITLVKHDSDSFQRLSVRGRWIYSIFVFVSWLRSGEW